MNELPLARFRGDHPLEQANLFLMMGFDPTPVRTRIQRLLAHTAASLGFDVVRADDHDYSGELWTNVKLCMDHCDYGIAVFDGDQACAENLAVELGYMFARDRSCLILREQGLGVPPAMLSHRLHTPFQALDLEGTLQPAVHRWLASQARRTVA